MSHTSNTSPSPSPSPSPSRPATSPTPEPFVDPNSVPSAPSARDVPVTIDPRGDLTLLAGTADPLLAPARIRVSSETLRRTSPVFAAMLFGGWRESRPVNGGEWVVELPDDQALAVQVVMGAAHARFEFVPRGIVALADFGVASDAVVVAEKYGMMGVLVPFTDAWLGTLGAVNGGWGGLEVVQRANVAWRFGEPGALGFVFRTAIWEMGRRGVEELREVAGRVTDLGMAANLTEILRPVERHRVELIQEILDFFHGRVMAPRSTPLSPPPPTFAAALIHGVAATEGACRRAPPGSKQGRGCDRWTVDWITSYGALEFIHKQRAADIEGSAEELINSMKVMLDRLLSAYLPGTPGHRMCCPMKDMEEFEGELERKWFRMGDLIDDRHFAEMRHRQAEMEYCTPMAKASHRFRYLL